MKKILILISIVSFTTQVFAVKESHFTCSDSEVRKLMKTLKRTDFTKTQKGCNAGKLGAVFISAQEDYVIIKTQNTPGAWEKLVSETRFVENEAIDKSFHEILLPLNTMDEKKFYLSAIPEAVKALFIALARQ